MALKIEMREYTAALGEIYLVAHLEFSASSRLLPDLMDAEGRAIIEEDLRRQIARELVEQLLD